MTDIGDIVLIYFEDQPTSYARVDNIEADVKRDWYQLTMTLLQPPSPPESITWILRDTYINGDEFTMQGKRIRLEKLEPSPGILERQKERLHSGEKNPAEKPSPGQVISFSDFKKH
ncbi:hypothetical protein OOT00_04200 [Desulfobotulus sp. H1]|uniref:Uncharacterized protein n=1 Tax=Desulfobotulus pelophilus TaxID=2823377 RepID=A0ABT3N6V2_9BACT|nr:hypothetical protein [Desulfobotulus pelophilus]MCW7753185.1 hypothetical protein [Desulfobotulus pelophilus]